MKKKGILALAAILIALTAVLVFSRPPQIPIQVSGGLTEREVSDISASVRRYMRPPSILPDLSRQSILDAPRALLERIRAPKPVIWKADARNDVFVAVTGRLPRDQPPRPYIFWAVFRGTNGWRVEHEYHYRRGP
jgi:hypothetical protein